MDSLSAFGLFALTAMLVCYAFEHYSHWFVLGFAMACVLGSVYSFLQGARPFGIVEAGRLWLCAVSHRFLRVSTTSNRAQKKSD
jgi:hypothetical protein